MRIVKAGWLWLAGVSLLFFYSFTQIDLGLTLTRASWWQVIQRAFQQIGYFHRPLSTSLYLMIILILFLGYFLLTRSSVMRNEVWSLILLTAAILLLAYNAFSYDLFNYIMDAKMITFYGKNPYQHKALDFAGDPMLGFMHWTHRTYPYGPVWLALSVPISWLGFQKLLATMILFKALAVASYLLACWLLWRLNDSNHLKLALFAFNPLVVVETLVSGHHDLLMMGLALAAFYFLKKKQIWVAWLLLLLSIGIKFATGLLLPVFVWVTYRQIKNKSINWHQVWWVSLVLMIIAVVAATYRIGHLMPWYLLYPLPFAVLAASLRFEVAIFSLGLLLTYAPFLYFGNWDTPVPLINNWLIFGSLALGVLVALKNLH